MADTLFRVLGILSEPAFEALRYSTVSPGRSVTIQFKRVASAAGALKLLKRDYGSPKQYDFIILDTAIGDVPANPDQRSALFAKMESYLASEFFLIFASTDQERAHDLNQALRQKVTGERLFLRSFDTEGKGDRGEQRAIAATVSTAAQYKSRSTGKNLAEVMLAVTDLRHALTLLKQESGGRYDFLLHELEEVRATVDGLGQTVRTIEILNAENKSVREDLSQKLEDLNQAIVVLKVLGIVARFASKHRIVFWPLVIGGILAVEPFLDSVWGVLKELLGLLG